MIHDSLKLTLPWVKISSNSVYNFFRVIFTEYTD